MRTAFVRALLAASPLALAACGASLPPKPDEQYARAQLAVQQAEAAGVNAAESPRLDAARRQIQEAQALMGREDPEPEDYVRARQLLEAAELDAIAAEAEARTTRSEALAGELRRSAVELRQELERKEGVQ